MWEFKKSTTLMIVLEAAIVWWDAPILLLLLQERKRLSLKPGAVAEQVQDIVVTVAGVIFSLVAVMEDSILERLFVKMQDILLVTAPTYTKYV
jgi:hypothetical protein